MGHKYSHKTELTVLNKMQKLLQNGETEWKSKELAIFQEFCRLHDGEYVSL